MYEIFHQMYKRRLARPLGCFTGRNAERHALTAAAQAREHERTWPVQTPMPQLRCASD